MNKFEEKFKIINNNYKLYKRSVDFAQFNERGEILCVRFKSICAVNQSLPGSPTPSNTYKVLLLSKHFNTLYFSRND